MAKILCKSCDNVVNIPENSDGYRCVCPCCGALLRPSRIEPDFSVSLVALSTMMLFVVSIFQPYLSVSSMGVSSSIKLISIFTILDYQWSFLLYIFLLVTFFAPLYVLTLIGFLGLNTAHQPGIFTCRLYALCHSLCMVDIFIVGVLVSLVKLTSLADVEFYSGFYLSFLFSVMLLWCLVKYTPVRLWSRLSSSDLEYASSGVRGRDQGLKLCRSCGMVFRSQNEEDRCPRCGAKVYFREKLWFQKVLALLCAALILYLPSNLYPVMYTEFLFSETGSNIIDGVIAMWQMQSYFVSLVILLASVFIPIFKILAMCFILYAVRKNKVSNPRALTKVYRTVHFIGRWSMIDVFVVIIMSAVVRMSGILTISPGFAIICFCSVVFTTLFAVDAFDERLIWDNKRD